MALSDLNPVERNEEGIAAVLGILKQRLGERFQTGQAIRAQHAHTTTYIPDPAAGRRGISGDDGGGAGDRVGPAPRTACR